MPSQAAWNRNPDDSQNLPTRPPPRELDGTEAVHAQLEKLQALLKRMKRHWLWGLAGFALVTAISSVFVLRYTPGYLSETVVFHQPGMSAESLGGGATATDPTILRELLLQRGRMEKLVNELKLHQDTVERYGVGVAVDELRKTIQFEAIGKSTFKITFVGDSPEQAQEVTAWLANELVTEDLQRRQAHALVQKKFLEEELGRAKKDLSEAEQSKAAFMALHPEVMALAAGQVAPKPAAAPKPEDKPKPKGKPRHKTVLVPAPVPSGSAVVAPPPPPPKPKPKVHTPDPKLVAEREAAVSELAQAARALAQVQASYTDEHPDVQAAKKRVAAAESRVKTTTDALRSAAQDDIYADDPEPAPAPRPPPPRPAGSAAKGKAPAPQQVKIRVPVAPAKKKKKKKADKPEPEPIDSTRAGAVEAEWMRLAGIEAEARNRTDRLAAEAFAADVASRSRGAGHDARVVVLDEAFRPARPLRSRLFILKIGLPLALLVGFALLVVRAILDDRIYDVDDLKQMGFDPLLTVVPGSRDG